MRDTWLVQRLSPPAQKADSVLAAVSEAFAFGGGLPNGGLTDQAVGILRDLFQFEYMGSAEFEFGAVPAALKRIAEYALNGELAAAPYEFLYNDDRRTIWLIGVHEDLLEIATRVESWTAPWADRPRMKEPPQLDRVLDGDEYIRTCGWLELDNGWFAFTNRDMWEAVAGLFELDVPEQPSIDA